MLSNIASGPWLANPFDLSHSDRTMEQNLKVMKSNWWSHRFTKALAARLYAEGHRVPADEAVQNPDEFRGWDGIAKSAKGVATPLDDHVPLREEVRRLLQRHTETFMDWNHHKDQFDVRVPNPYRNRIDSGTAGKLLPEHRNWKD